MLLDLNKQQQEAASIITGPVMVFAGAGSGKTRTLTYRIANMIENNIDPRHILAITFTNKATNEMRERLHQLVGPQASQLTISTFHSLCARILRRDIGVLGYSNRFLIIDDEDQLKVIGDVLVANNINKKLVKPRSIRKKINMCKCLDIKPELDIEKEILNKYEAYMKQSNLLDFEDLLIKVRELFQKHPRVLERYQEKFKHVLVDEFQDTDLIQYQILNLLSNKHRNIFVVGDDDQSIYSFRGTNYENMKFFKKDYPEHKLIILNQNYRSTQTILDCCNNLITNNVDREIKELYSKIKGSETDVVVHQARDEGDEVGYVINNINQLIDKGYQYKDFAILYRSSVVLRNFELGMIQTNIPYRVFGGVSYLRRKEIKDMIAYLRLIVYADDVHSFRRVVNEPSRGIGDKTLEKLLEYQQQNKITLFEAIDDSKNFLKNKSKILIDFKNLINSFQEKLDETNLVELYEELLAKTAYIESLDDDESLEDRKENLEEFKSILYSIENSGEVASRSEKLIAAFDEAILSDDKLQSQKHTNDGVTLSTVHSVKGLEYAAVFVVAFENGIFPNLYRFDDNINVEEERRIAYVATTRAKNKLFLSCAKRRMLYGSYHTNPQSKFLLELVDNQNQSYKFDDDQQEVLEIKDASQYKVGDKVEHSTYGEGIIVSLNKEVGQICFTNQGVIKTFDMTHPAISKK